MEFHLAIQLVACITQLTNIFNCCTQQCRYTSELDFITVHCTPVGRFIQLNVSGKELGVTSSFFMSLA
mgnify:CR=1 FL=1